MAYFEKIAMTAVGESKNIEAVGYSDDSNTLRVKFMTSGRTYDYQGVPKAYYFDMTSGNVSVGAFFYKNIRNKYPTAEVTGRQDEA